MLIENPDIKAMRICQRTNRRGLSRRTLVMDTDIAIPPTTSTRNFKRLVEDLDTLKSLSNEGFVDFEAIEIHGPYWHATVHDLRS